MQHLRQVARRKERQEAQAQRADNDDAELYYRRNAAATFASDQSIVRHGHCQCRVAHQPDSKHRTWHTVRAKY